MKILFIFSLYFHENPKKPIQQLFLHLGISYISSLLKSKGYQTNLLVLTKILDKKLIDKYIYEFNPILICFTAVSKEYNFIKSVAQYIKTRYPSIFLLIGGSHASLVPDTVIKGPFNALCIGEGEYPTLELAQQLKEGRKPNNIPNLWIKDGKNIEKNPTREFLQDLDVLPFPDREIWEKWLDDKNSNIQVILLGRGCPYKCPYCCNHAFRKLSKGTYVRLRSVDNVIKELNELITNLPNTREIYFEVETIATNLRFVENLCFELTKLNSTLKNPLLFGVNLRIVPKIDFKLLFRVLNKANFKFVKIGLESGSEKIRSTILRRYYSNFIVIKTIQLAKKHGLQVITYNMIGLPEESVEDFKETIKINRIILPDFVELTIFSPYPGTDLYKFCEKNDLFNKNIDVSKVERMERHISILNLKKFPPKKILKQFNWFYYNVYRGYRPIYDTVGYVLWVRKKFHPKLYEIYLKISKPLRKIMNPLFTKRR